jgi:hypothetical protein
LLGPALLVVVVTVVVVVVDEFEFCPKDVEAKDTCAVKANTSIKRESRLRVFFISSVSFLWDEASVALLSQGRERRAREAF